MQTISDIIFDSCIYPLARVSSLLLYDMTGTHFTIPLPNAHLMPFIRPFKTTAECKNHINDNTEKNITLFTYEDNTKWLITNSYFENTPQLHKINIFCSSVEDQDYWTRRTERCRNKIEEPILYEELDVTLLLFGLKHTRTVYNELAEQEDSISNRVKEDRRKIMEALSIHFKNKANAEDEETRQSKEAQS